ncbi:hypothetical protein ABT324_00720 [Saccharopolyspora sp. NPDC000359]|uniref:hypothetical protein n=1 Tax=Saccharopolyspora sp. NPDC000359 TaxID=3154251 RepID=UPI003326D307
MSVELLNVVLRSDLAPLAKRMVATALASVAPPEALTVYPSVAHIADLAGVGRSTVRKYLAELERDGVITRTPRSNSSNIYKFHPERFRPATRSATSREVPPESEQAPEPATEDTAPRQEPEEQAPATPPPHGPHPSSSWTQKGNRRGTERSLDGDAPAPKPTRHKPRSRLPYDWRPTDAHRAFAAEHHLDIDREAFRFRHHADATGRLMANWNAAFTTWLDKARDLRPAGSPRTEDWRRFCEQ